jgi:hypothetical protein
VTSRRTKADVDQVAVTIPLHADRRNFYKVEKWSRDGQRVEEMLFVGNSAQQLFSVVPLANSIIFRNHVSVTEGMQEPA